MRRLLDGTHISSVGDTSDELYATQVDAAVAQIDTAVATIDYTDTECDAVVADDHLTNWRWRVRAKDSQGQFTPGSDWLTFQFAPCRLSDGTACHVAN